MQPELTVIENLELNDDKINVIRDELADVKRMTRKISYESIPALNTKLYNLDVKINHLESLILKILEKF